MHKLLHTELLCLVILFTTVYATVIYQDPGSAVVCKGAADDDSQPTMEIDHYNQLKLMFEGCNYVLGNIEIYPMPGLSDVSLDFFSNITEVSGYVRVHGPLPTGITKLPFTNLRIVRGESLTRYSDTTEDEYSLFIFQTPNLVSHALTSLREISRGNVYIGYNRDNCYGDTIEWKDIFGGRSEQRADIVYHDSNNCPPKAERCHSSCGDSTNSDGYCWGPEAEDCQELNFVNCALQCDYRCYGEDSNHCCHRDCLAGCNGPLDTDCWGCRNFYDNGTCTHECPRETIYNKTTYTFETNPNAKVAFGKLCLDKCPSGYFEHNQGCLLYGCPEGYINNDEDKCVLCDGPCPKDCDWTELKDRESYWPTPTWLRNFTNENCTRITGDVDLVSGAFDTDAYKDEDAISVEDLKVFENVEEISGIFTFEPGSKLPDLKSMSVFKNLRKVGGSGAIDYSFVVVSDHLESLDMPYLQEVSNGAIWFLTPALCYSTADTLRGLFPRVGDQSFYVSAVQNPSKCAAQEMVCDEECGTGCVGAGPKQCVTYCNLTLCEDKCLNYDFEGECVADCSGDGLYMNDTKCIRCHEECGKSCSGPLETDCSECKNYMNGNRCVPDCPNPTYPDDDKICLPCNQFCSFAQEFGCDGPESTIGENGCDACDLILLSDSGKEIERCLNASEKCPSGYLTFNQWSKLTVELQQVVPEDGFSKGCLKCNPECAECEGRPQICNKCSDLAYEWKKQNSRHYDFDCIPEDECDKMFNHVNESSRECIACHDACYMCHGPTDMDCESCKGIKIHLNGTGGFQCVHECPPHLNYTWFNEETKGKECHASPPPSAAKVKDEIPLDIGVIVGSIAGVMILVAVVAIILTWICRQRTKQMALAKEYELKMIVPGTVEPLDPTGADPDLSQLRLIKESELKKTVVIGSGAFGTVYKGYLIPENEHVKVTVAIKVLTEGTNPNQTTELLDEARVMASVDHPCCIKIVAVCMTAQMMLVTPLMSSGCLLNYVQNKGSQLGSKVLINWCAQIAKGMEYLQRCGIVHRDLAARNVLVQNETQLKITDFGLAKLLDFGEDYYKADSGKVPIKWMALESIQHRIFNHQTDVWSYGVTIWEILTFGQKPYDGVKARDIAILLERGERLSQPSISTIDVYMIMIKCWMLDANTRPTFEDLTKEFTKMARDPGRYLVIEGDQLKRNPTLKMNSDWNFDEFQDGEDEFPEKQLVAADDYLSPSIASNYPRYENEDAMPPPFEKSLQSYSGDNLHSPLRYTSSPTLRPPSSEGDRLFVDTAPSENYLQPVPSRGATIERPAVDDDGYLQPQSTTSVYIDVLADERTNLSPIKNKRGTDSDDEDSARQPLLGADNSIYLCSKDGDFRARPSHLTDSNPILSATQPNGSNPLYMSNNNGSPVHKQPPAAEYVNQDIANVV